MENSSQVSQFTLGAYFDPGPLRWLYFLIIMSVYALIVLSNLLLIVVICLNRKLHEPMYIFLCSLLINEIYGSTVFFPFILFQIVQDLHNIPYSLCLFHIFCVYFYRSVEFTNLAVMSYDRYVAICFPLQYHTHMNFNRVVVLVVLIWLPPFVAVFITTVLTSSLTLCGNFISKVYCDYDSLIKLSCFDTTVYDVYELVAASVTVIIPLTVIFFTYIQILRVCFNGSKQTQQKALSTCTPHLCSVVNLAFGVSFDILEHRFVVSYVPQILPIFTSVYFLIQPLSNPLMYGLKLTKIRTECKNVLLLVCTKRNNEVHTLNILS